MLTATPQNWVGWDFEISEGGRQVAVIDQAWWRERGTFSVEGGHFEVRREGLLGAFVLTGRGGQRVAWAEKDNPFTRSFTVHFGGHEYALRAAGVFSQGFEPYRGDQLVGSIRKRGWFSRAANVDLPADLPLAVRVFVFWLVLILWRRAANSSNGAA